MFSSFCQLPLENRKRGIRLLRVIIVWANFIMAFIFNYQQGQFKSMPYINLLLSLTIINLFMHSDHDDSINDGYCQCNVCISKSSKLQPPENNNDSSNIEQITQNCIPNFIELFPRNFPICITPTVCPKQKMFYFNKSTNRLAGVPFTKITDHFPLATNVVLFYPNRSLIAHKYQLIKEDSNYIYVQVYNPSIPFIVQYHKDEQFMDEVLREKLISLVKNIVKDDSYDWTPAEKDFLLWVHKDYQDTVFCKYMAKIYCDCIEKLKKDKIISAKFEWIIEKPGLIRLQNVRSLVVQRNKRSATFQEQYEQKILEKLNMKNPNAALQISLFNTFIKPSKINYRINNFKNQIRQIFQYEKLKILKKTQKERTVETNTLSDDVARLFLPQLHKYSSLREVLSDEQKFKKVVLGMKEQKKKVQKPFRRTEIPNQPISVKKSVQKRHYRSKTQM